MTNFYITNDYKLKKIYGYKTFYNFGSPIKGMYSTNLGGTEYLLVAVNDKLYYFLKSDLEGDWESIGDIPTYPVEEVPYLTQTRQLISTIFLPMTNSYIRTYATLLGQSEHPKTSTYRIDTTFFSQTNNTHIPHAYLYINDRQTEFNNLDFPRYQEVPLAQQTFTTPHTAEDGSSPLQNITTQWSASYGGSGNVSVNIQFPNIPPHPGFYGITPTLIGDIGTGDVSFFTFDKKVYILSGKYHSWDGTTLEEVEGYTPLVYINTPPGPDGGGIVYDELNVLSNKRHQTFNIDGTSTEFKLAEREITSVDKVILYNTELTPTTDYTIDLSAGKVILTTAPTTQVMDGLDVYWTKNTGDRAIIEGMKFGTIFGGDLDTRVFLYGNPDCQNRTYFSGLEDGVPSVEYFPASAFVDVGPSNFALTDLTRQYDRLLATTDRPEAYYMTISTEKLDVTLDDNSHTTRYVPAVSTFPLNEVHGNFAPGQGQLIDNYPVTFDKSSLTLWKATNVRDEKNMEDISQKIKLDLIKLDPRRIVSLDHQSDNQLWFGVENKIYIYNYFNKTYSRLSIADDLSRFADLGNSVYMGTIDGKVMQWGEQYDGFDENIIDAYWEMNFSDFDSAYLRKTMNRLWVLMQPQAKCGADIGFITNRSSSASKKHIGYNIQIMDNVDFTNYTFEISNNPQPFRLKMKAKKFTNLKITIENNEKSDCTILQLILKVESFGESK